MQQTIRMLFANTISTISKVFDEMQHFVLVKNQQSKHEVFNTCNWLTVICISSNIKCNPNPSMLQNKFGAFKS